MSPSNRPADISTFHLRRRTPGSFLLVPCPRQNRSIRCQGQLEAATAVILVGCPQVQTIQEQPLAIWYTWQESEAQITIKLLDGPPATHPKRHASPQCSYVVPDFLVDMKGGHRRLVEVKPSERLTRPKVQRKLAVARQFAIQSGWTFHVVTEKQLVPGCLLSNLRLLNRYRQARLDDQVMSQVVSLVSASGVELAALRTSIFASDPGLLRLHVFHLLATDRLSFDPRSKPLDDKTVLFPGGVIAWDPFDSVWAPRGCSTDGSGGSSANSPPTASSPKTFSFT